MRSTASRNPLRKIVSLLFVLALFFGCLAAAAGGIAYAEQSTKEDEIERLADEIERLQAELDRIKGESTSQTPAGVAVDSSNFPDAIFRSYVVENCDTDQDGFLSEAEIAEVTSIDVSVSEIADLTGIEFFTALESLDCSMNSLESLDMSANTALESLVCHDNQLTSLDVSANTALSWLDCNNNQLTSLDISANTALSWLDCNNNQLTSLDLRANTELASLFCRNNQLTSLDLSVSMPSWLMCEGNHLTHLDLSHLWELTESAVHDQTVPIKLEERDGIYRFDFATLVGAENIGRMTVTGVTPAGAQYTVRDGVLSSDTELTSITYVYSHGNTAENLTMDVTLLNMACVPVPKNTLAIDAHSFPDANFRRYIASRHDADHDGFLSPEELRSVMYIDVRSVGLMNFSGMEIADLTGIRHFPALTTLICTANQLTSLDLSGCTSLISLRCPINMLTNLDVSGCTSLTRLDCSQNQLTRLDVSASTSLTELICHSNQLASLDVSANSALAYLDCNYNNLHSLDVSCCPYLSYLDCDFNALTSLDLSANTMLTRDYDYYHPSSVSDQFVEAAMTEADGTYRLDFADLVGAENVDRVTVTAVAPADVPYSVQDGVLTAEAALTSLKYEYDHGGPDIGKMDVTLDLH